eukprot:838317-Prymnesium_polylepis.1
MELLSHHGDGDVVGEPVSQEIFGSCLTQCGRQVRQGGGRLVKAVCSDGEDRPQTSHGGSGA